MAVQHDTNMIVETKLNKPDIKFYNIDCDPFKIYGVWREGDSYLRIPQNIADNISPGIKEMCRVTAGGRIRFVTDSPYVAIKVEYGIYETTSTIANLATVGFDMYADRDFVGSFRPPNDFCGEDIESVVDIRGERKKRLITVNMPLYAEIKSMYIGLAGDAEILHAPEYKHEKPVVFYGSSITNGAGASRPGATYESRISRRLDMNFHCLGFGGLAKGEPEMAEYVSGLDMSVFVYDYDYNAVTPEDLLKTHEPMFKTVRERNPKLPIIIISRPNAGPETEKRFEIIKKTYDNAKAAGDENVWLLKGTDFYCKDNGVDFTTDGVHPSDLGFYFMAEGIYPILAKILQNFT